MVDAHSPELNAAGPEPDAAPVDAEETDAEKTDAEKTAGEEIPAEVHADYANDAVRAALHALQETPDYPHLAAFLLALREGYLVVDITGTAGKKRGPRARTLRSTSGQLVLPIFTSMAELRAVAPASRAEELKGAVMPAQQALALIASDRFVAAEFDKASAALVVLRKYVTLAASSAEITAESVAALK